MCALTAWRGAWRRFWFGPCDPGVTGPFRIGLGLSLLVLYGALLPNWQRFYGAQGVLASARFHPDWLDVYRWAGPDVPALLFGWLSLACAAARSARSAPVTPAGNPR